MEKKFVRKSLGSKKLAPVDMKKNEYQYVIDAYLIEDVLKQIPDDINIIQAQVNIYTQTEKKKLVVPVYLKKKGVSYLRELGAAKEAVFVFDKIKKEKIVSNVKEVCELQKFTYEKSFFQYIVLSNHEATAKFIHCTKEQRPDETDLRKKLRVMGCVSGTGKVQGLLAQLSAIKFHCQIKEELVKMIMCSKD